MTGPARGTTAAADRHSRPDRQGRQMGWVHRHGRPPARRAGDGEGADGPSENVASSGLDWTFSGLDRTGQRSGQQDRLETQDWTGYSREEGRAGRGGGWVRGAWVEMEVEVT